MESATTNHAEADHRLGNCEVCNALEAKYTCPKCEVKTCSLKCVNLHKKELECDGARDKTKFIPIKKMTTMDYESDYRFLEECTRFVDDRKRDPIKTVTSTQGLPQYLIRLRKEAELRKTTLKFLCQNFTKRKQNTTKYDAKAKKIMWRVEWVMLNCQGITLENKQCDEDQQLVEIFEGILETSTIADLDYYKSCGTSRLLFLLKAEGIPNCSNRFYEVDIQRPLKETLENKIIVEFPVIYVVFADTRPEFDIIPEDEEVDLLSTAILKNKKRKLEEGKIMQEKTSAVNFLFSNEDFWESSGSEDEGDTKNKMIRTKE